MPVTIDDINAGTLELDYQDRAFTPIACGYHTPRTTHDQKKCPACNDPQASAITGIGPAHSEDAVLASESGINGYQAGCEACVATAGQTIDYVNGLELRGDVEVVNP